MEIFLNGNTLVRAFMAIISFNLNSHWHFTLGFVSSTNKQHQFENTFEKQNENFYGIFSTRKISPLHERTTMQRWEREKEGGEIGDPA